MSDRFVVIAVSLLSLLVMCGLLLAAVVWVPRRIDRLEKRLDRLEEVSAKVSVIHGLLGDLDKLEKRLAETTQSAPPATRLDSSVDEMTKVLNETVVAGLNDVKGRMAARADIDRLTTLLNQISQKLGGVPQSDPDVKKILKDLEEVKSLLDATRKSVDASTRDLAKDVKQLNLELQKIEAQLLKGAATP